LSLFFLSLLSVPITTQTAVLQLRQRRDHLPVSCLTVPCAYGTATLHQLQGVLLARARTPVQEDSTSSDSLSRKTEIALSLCGGRSDSVGSKESIWTRVPCA